MDLLLELLNGGEDLVVGVKVLKELVKELSDILVNPVSVLELGDHVDSVDISHDLKAILVGLQVVQKEKHNSHDLFLIEVVKDLGYLLNDLKSTIFESLQGEIVV